MAEFEPKQFGKYYLLEKLAVGGMAEIYKAKTFGVDGFEKQLALKRILPHCSADKDFITMLTDEAKLSVLLSHANIVQVYDLGRVGEDYFIAMEYVNGPNLRDIIYRCREKGVKMPPELAVYIISEVCKGLDYAHRKTDQNNKSLNIVHRDVSPQNIMISYEGEVKIVDFGIAKAAMNISHTMAGILKGKIAYMSPEQALGKAIDGRTDIFSSGIVLYEALTQEKLFTGESQFEVLKKIRTTKVNTEKFPEEVPEDLKAILAKSLAYSSKDRYQTAGEMQTDLTRFLYQTYIDFTPQKLAAFVKDLFADELKRQQSQAAREAALEAQTSSINVAQEALQENIVHREDTGITMKATAMEPLAGVGAAAPALPDMAKIRRRHIFRRITSVMTALVVLAAAGVAYWKYIHPAWFGKPTANVGTVSINTTPSGARIFLDGKETELTTPAILEDLQLRKVYKVKLKKDGFADLSHTLMAETTEPMSLQFSLSKAMGTLKISSEPSGAKITIDEEDTGKETPATITSLELNKDTKVILSKADFKDFEKTLKLENMTPVDIDAKLEKILYGNLKVTSDPSGAAISLNGKSIGKSTPATLEKLIQGEKYTVAVNKKGFTGFTKTITLDKDEVSLSGKLEEIKIEKTTLSVSSNPSGAAIYLGGRNTGKTTPATLADLQVKKSYTVKLTKSNYKSWSKRVYIASAKPQSVTGYLKELGAAPPVEPTPTPPPIEPRPKPTPPPPEPAPTGGFGTIKVSSKPSGADVFINAEHKGTTPATVRVPSGLVSVLVNKSGYMRYSTKVSVGPGQTKNLGTIKLGGLYGEVSIVSTPPAATVIFDGQNIGAKTPVTVRKVRRDQGHSVTVSLPGYRSWSRSFKMGNEPAKSFNIMLERQ